MCYDPIGQGERSQILADDGQPEFSSTTQEHFLVGVGSILVGTNTARYRVWDGMRAIDYVAGRPELDPRRIGFTGCSGGGTLTSYVMALDDRVTCAAPACYLTTFRRLIETIGPQDAEQNIFGQLAYGLDQPDYVLLRAPRPTLISSTTGDFFDVEGSWDNYRQAKRIYTRLGFPERVGLVEAEGGHGVQPANLTAITRWFRRWLLEKDDAVELAPIVPRSEEELRCTERGQVLRLPGERSVFDLNAELEIELAKERRELWASTPQEEMLERVRVTAGVRALDQLPEPKFEEAGRVDREDYHIDKFVLYTDSGVPLPGLTFHPPSPQDEAYLYLHEDGKLGDSAPGGAIEKLVSEGHVVVAVDLRGTGETGNAKPDAVLGEWKSFYLAYLLGQSMVGLHTEDVIAAGRFVANYKTKTPRKVQLVAVGRHSVPALHAAALAPELFETVTLKQPLQAWSPIVEQPVPAGMLPLTVHGALALYDLPDLARVIGNEKLKTE
jgi:dienelactone hydrolase